MKCHRVQPNGLMRSNLGFFLRYRVKGTIRKGMTGYERRSKYVQNEAVKVDQKEVAVGSRIGCGRAAFPLDGME